MHSSYQLDNAQGKAGQTHPAGLLCLTGSGAQAAPKQECADTLQSIHVTQSLPPLTPTPTCQVKPTCSQPGARATAVQSTPAAGQQPPPQPPHQ
jgi:hypothetical protein